MKSRFENATIILLSFSRLEDAYSSVSLMLARELAKERPVYFINNPYTIFDYIKNIHTSAYAGKWNNGLSQYSIERPFADRPLFFSVSTPLLLSINWMPPSFFYRFFQKRNSKVLQKMLTKLIEKRGIEEYIFFNSTAPIYHPIIPESYPPLQTIYQCVDDISQADYLSKHAAEAEEVWMRTSDLNLVTSKGLKELRKQLNKNIFVLPNAGDFTLFNKALETQPRPAELEGLTGNIVGFVGNLDNRRIDFALLKALAAHHADKHFVFVGPFDAHSCKKYGLDNISNVHFTGSKPMEILPSYLHYFDCTIIPFLKNKLTSGIYPLKINEYLAAGKQVVATNFSIDIAGFKDNIFLVETHKEFIEAIDDAIAQDSSGMRKKMAVVASTNSYPHRVKQLYDIIHSHNQRKEKNQKQTYGKEV